MNIKKITGKEVKDAVEWLWKNKFGCYHFAVFNDEDGTEFDIVIGWSEYGEEPWEDNKFYYYDERYRIAWKVGIQSRFTGMQTDFDLDFEYPVDENDFVIGCRESIRRDASFEDEAKRMNKEVKRVLK